MDTYKEYTTTLENAKGQIADKGVAVIPNILSTEEITQYRTDYVANAITINRKL